jgi:lipoprotein-anchoring transpeptidase ErfK/SrfK
MTLLDRYRAYRADPYRHYGSRSRWGVRAATAAPLLVVLVIVANVAVLAMKPGVKQDKSLDHVAGLSYRALLVPSQVAPKFPLPGGQASRSNNHSAQRSLSGSDASATQTGRAASTGATSGNAAALPHAANRSTRSHPSYRTDANGYRVAPSRDAALVPTTTWLAHLEHSKRGYPGRNALQSDRKVPGSWYGYPSILPVLNSTADRMQVRLAQRPDESTTWITRSAVVMTRTHYAIVVDISQHWLYVFRYGVEQASYPVGTGARGTPTPTGSYFLAFHAPPNSGADYGSVMLETSAHSRVISHFEGGNDAIIAIHGPISSQSDAEIGNHGAAISNGCIRMHNRDLNQVKHVPNGTPIILTD